MRVRFAATSFTPEVASAYNEVMDKVSRPVHAAIADLRSAAKGYSWTKLITLGPIVGTGLQAPESTRNAILSALGTLDRRLQQVEARRPDVLNGSLVLSRWVGAVAEIFKGVQVQARDLKESTIFNEMTATFTDSVNEVRQKIADLEAWLKDLGQKAKGGLAIGLPLIGVAAVLAAIYIVPRLLGPTVIVRGMDGPTLNPKRPRGKRLY